MSELLNLVGLSAGVVLYAMLLAMVVPAGRRASGTSRRDPLLLATAILGLVWNLCALPAYELPKVGITAPLPLLAAIGFSALGFLPAVVVQSALRTEREGVRGAPKRTIVAVAYGVSVLAMLMHFSAALIAAPVPSGLAMEILTYTFVALVPPLALVTRGQRGSRRALWAAALAIFAVSALHLSSLHQGDASWPVELLGHHASLPLAFAILYQDYRFALADLFLKRALALLAVLALAFSSIAIFGQRSAAFAQFLQVGPRQVGILVSLWIVTALVYPELRRGVAWLVDAIILNRPNYRSLKLTVARRIQAHDDPTLLLDETCVILAPALSARVAEWRRWPGTPPDDGTAIVYIGSDAQEILGGPPIPGLAAVVLIPTSEQPQFAITIAELAGGRSLLSDDVATLESIALSVARRLDAIRITHERYERELREQEIAKLASEAELRALRAQINPHFLFNALTTIGYLIQTAPPRAFDTLMRLTSLLRGVLRSEGELTTLGHEIEIVEAYLDIERARFEDRLRVDIDVAPPLRHLRVPPLVLQPLVENAVKHGIAPLHAGGSVTVSARMDESDRHHPFIVLTVSDTGAGSSPAALERGRAIGVGLSNVDRRLTCQYGAAASLAITSQAGRGTKVEVRLPVEQRVEAGTPDLARTGTS